MKKIYILFIILLLNKYGIAQNTLQLLVQDTSKKQPLTGATVLLKEHKQQALTDSLGQATFTGLPNGKLNIVISHVTYETQTVEITLPVAPSFLLEVNLQPEEEELEEVTISTTRTSRNIKNVPTRVESIDEEEIDEKSNMRPSNVSMILHESTGIQVQQTSATSANASIRIQGLDGRYTQLLKDGYPNYGNFASGLSVLEIPPLDLKQVEVIKGPASTLYGGGAIAGVINFISKIPEEKPAYHFIINKTSLGGNDYAAFISAKNKNIGITLLASANFQKAFDVDNDDFTELPKTSYYTFSPKMFFYVNDNNTITVNNSYSHQLRTGGDINVIKGNSNFYHTYFEKNKSYRNISSIEWERKFSGKNKLIVKQSFSIFNRTISIPGYSFKGVQKNTFTDISYLHNLNKHTFIVGANYWYDDFKENAAYSGISRNSYVSTAGVFVQDTWDVSSKLSFENGLRIDGVRKYGIFILPRISALYKFSNAFSSRVSAGLGYKTPTIFTEQTETIQYQNVLPLNNVEAERSYGGTVDISYRKKWTTDFSVFINQLFFYSRINRPLVLDTNLIQQYYFRNASQDVQSAGFETNAKFIYKDRYKLFAGYTYTYATARYLTGNQFIRLIPKHKINLALIYEIESNIKAGLEAYYTGKQILSNGTTTQPFWEMGCMIEKIFSRFSIFINAENFTDIRQGRYKRVSNAPHNNPSFDEIWTHTEGRSFNGGIKIRL